MARIIFSPLVSAITGKLGSAIIQGNTGGYTVKQQNFSRPEKRPPKVPPPKL